MVINLYFKNLCKAMGAERISSSLRLLISLKPLAVVSVKAASYQ